MCLSIETIFPEQVLARGSWRGFDCVVVHNNNGFRCGYLRVPKGHPWHGRNYDDVPAEVHGGLTFAQPDYPCGKRDDGWWLGFDCCHAGDLIDPELPAPFGMGLLICSGVFGEPVTIKTTEFVKRELRKLAEQAAKA